MPASARIHGNSQGSACALLRRSAGAGAGHGAAGSARGGCDGRSPAMEDAAGALPQQPAPPLPSESTYVTAGWASGAAGAM